MFCTDIQIVDIVTGNNYLRKKFEALVYMHIYIYIYIYSHLCRFIIEMR